MDVETRLIPYDKSIEAYEKLVKQEGRLEFSSDLAKAYFEKGSFLYKIGLSRQAEFPYIESIEIYEQLVKQKNCLELSKKLAYAYVSNAEALLSFGQSDGLGQYVT